MKELSIEEKAKRYDELKVIAQELEEDGCFDKLTLFDLFLELAESEDEKIRKELIKFFNNFNETGTWKSIKSIDAWIAWLENAQYAIEHAKREGFQLGYKAGIEKQGEQKPDDNKESTMQSYITPNQKFFQWIYDRLIYVHNENPNVDYMLSLKERIKDM